MNKEILDNIKYLIELAEENQFIGCHHGRWRDDFYWGCIDPYCDAKKTWVNNEIKLIEEHSDRCTFNKRMSELKSFLEIKEAKNIPSEFAQKMSKAAVEAARAEVKKHHDAGRSVPVWRDGKVVEIPPPSRKENKSFECYNPDDLDSACDCCQKYWNHIRKLINLQQEPEDPITTFNNVHIHVPAKNSKIAYKNLCDALALIPGCEWETKTYCNEDGLELERSTEELFGE